MSTLDGVGSSAPAPTTPARVSSARTGTVQPLRGRALADDVQVQGFDPVSALAEAALGAASPPPAGLSAQLLDWASPSPRQFDSISSTRLLPLLSLAVDRLADEADRSDELGELGAVALTRELQDHQALAERRATMIDS